MGLFNIFKKSPPQPTEEELVLTNVNERNTTEKVVSSADEEESRYSTADDWNEDHTVQTVHTDIIPTNDMTANTILSIVKIVRSMEDLVKQEIARDSYNNLYSQQESRKKLTNDAKAYFEQRDRDLSDRTRGYIKDLFFEVRNMLERCEHNDCRYHWITFCIHKQFFPYMEDYIDETQIPVACETAINLAPDYLRYRFKKEKAKENPDFEFLVFNQQKLKREYENAQYP